jgi:RNA recognition motif-containing protein
LYVDCVPFHWTEDQLREVFGRFGPIRSTRLKKFPIMQNTSLESSEFMIKNHMSQVTQIAYVMFENHLDAANAIAGLNGKMFDMNTLRIQWFETNPDKQQVYVPPYTP